jgi:hypothetical protein
MSRRAGLPTTGLLRNGMSLQQAEAAASSAQIETLVFGELHWPERRIFAVSCWAHLRKYRHQVAALELGCNLRATVSPTSENEGRQTKEFDL